MAKTKTKNARPEVVGTHEIEERWGLNRGQVHTLVHAGDFPEPLGELRLGRVWDVLDVERKLEELYEAGRLTSRGHIVPWRFLEEPA